MNTNYDPQLTEWLSNRQRPDSQGVRWRLLLIAVACFVAVGLLAVHEAKAGGTVTDSKYIWLQRSGVTLTDKTTPKLACPVNTMTECIACMVEMYDEERRRRTSGYVTYRCMDVSQSYVKFNSTPVPKPPVVEPPPPPVAQLQVYACADAGADGRVLESATIAWPNCATASYQNPSRSLVVATNDDGVLRWRSAQNVTTGRVWTQTGTVGAWTPVGDISWGTPPTALGMATITWTPPTQNTDGTSLTNLAGYRVMYGPGPSLLVQGPQVPANVSTTVVENLTPGTWHFAVKAYTTDGKESANSNIASLVIR